MCIGQQIKSGDGVRVDVLPFSRRADLPSWRPLCRRIEAHDVAEHLLPSAVGVPLSRPVGEVVGAHCPCPWST